MLHLLSVDIVNECESTVNICMKCLFYLLRLDDIFWYTPGNNVHGANMGPTWVLSASGGAHVGLMNLAIWAIIHSYTTFVEQPNM